MNTLYQLQFACFIVTTMFALMLLISRFQMRWLNRRYENSRWLIFFAMMMLATHYVLQMHHGLRAQSDEIGAVVNILFYTPIAFLVSCATYNVVSGRKRLKHFMLISCGGYILILACFFVGFFHTGSLRVGVMLYAMFALFLVSILYFIVTIFYEMRRRRKQLENETGADLLPYDRYVWSSYILMCVSVCMLMGGIVYRPLLYYIGPLMLVSLLIFTMSFISFGFNLMPSDGLLEDGEEDDVNDMEALDLASSDLGNLQEQSFAFEDYDAKENKLSEERLQQIAEALQDWREKGGYRDSTVSIGMLSTKVRISRSVLSIYFEKYLNCTFRVWLSDIRFQEAQRMLMDNPEYSNDTISSECGFSSHAHLYKIFKAKTGMTPGQWKETLPAWKTRKK